MGYYKISDETIEEVARRWADDDIWEKAYDAQIHAWYPIERVLPYREYHWTREHARRDPEEWDELKESMSHGWDERYPLFVLVGRDGKVKLGEGNHRIAIAKELGIGEVPVQFQFYQNVSGGVPVAPSPYRSNPSSSDVYYVENPPWSNKLIEANRAEIEEAGLPMPTSVELGTGHYGAVYETEDPELVFKVTSDPTEAHFIKKATPLGWPEGIVKYRAIIDFEGEFRKRSTYGIWREAAIQVGLRKPFRIETNDDQYLEKFWWELEYFRESARVARDTIKAIDKKRGTEGLMEEVKSLEEWAHERVTWDIAMPIELRRWHSYMGESKPPVPFAMRFRGAQRIAIALKACEVVAMAMETSSYFGAPVGTALSFYLDNGILLADVHQNNVGVVARGNGGWELGFADEVQWVITDPGHAVFLDEL